MSQASLPVVRSLSDGARLDRPGVAPSAKRSALAFPGAPHMQGGIASHDTVTTIDTTNGSANEVANVCGEAVSTGKLDCIVAQQKILPDSMTCFLLGRSSIGSM